MTSTHLQIPFGSISTVKVDDGVDVFYRYAGAESLPVVLLLHGLPSSSFQYRNLIPIIASTGKYRVIAPDLPGYGFTHVPKERNYKYTFDSLKNTVAAFLDALKIDRFAVYIFDYGAPVALRLALERPQSFAGIFTQNGNAYVEGLGQGFWAPFEKYWNDPSQANRDALIPALQLDSIKSQYVTGAPDPAALAPETWHLDTSLIHAPGNIDIQLDLFLDYRTNVALYPDFQAYFKKYQPPLTAIWGKNDIIFVPPGATAFKRDLPHATVQFVDAGHFALESNLEDLASGLLKFLETEVKF